MNKNKYVELNRTIRLYNVSFLKNPKSYVIGMILPICISILLEFIWAHYSEVNIFAPEVISFMYVSIILGSFYVGLFARTLKDDKFSERVNIKINNKNLIRCAFIVVELEITIINMVLTTIIFYVISRFDIVGFKKTIFADIRPTVWVYYVIFGVLLGLMSGMIFLTLALLNIKTIYSILISSAALLFILAFSDTVIPAKLISNNFAMNIIGYFNPIKYVTWSMDLLSSYQFEDKFGSFQIYDPEEGSFEPFNNLLETTLPAVALTIGLVFAYGFRKEGK